MKLADITDKTKKPTKSMIKNFEKRTNEHIARVAKCLRKMYSMMHDEELLNRAAIHDESKFQEVEREPYVWITEFYRCKNKGISFTYPPGVEERTRKASLHHVTTNRHHPEFHDNPHDMTDIDIIEMVCDWTAMAQELGENNGSARGYAKKVVNIKWDFSDDQVKLIYDTIKKLDS